MNERRATPTKSDEEMQQTAPPGGRLAEVVGLPPQLTSLVGRESEIDALVDLLRSPDVRLVTLTGPGGTGKTRLAIAAASELGDAFPDGVSLVDLSPLADPGLVAPTVARALGVQEAETPLLPRLRAFLKPCRLLLVLDNLEHLLGSAPLVSELLRAAPGLSVLATSRERLRLSGERVVPVDPLSVPDPGDVPGVIASAPAVRLFLERAVALSAGDVARSNLGAVAEVCRRLDGLPPAIELAAGWARALTPGVLLDALDRRLPMLSHGELDRQARHETMRAAIAWSYDLLSSEEQSLFRRIGVFTGGFTIEAAAAIGEFGELGAEARTAPAAMPGVLRVLASLVDKSVLRREPAAEPRFRMMETIREFALEQLAACGEEDAVRSAHADYFKSIAERSAGWRAESQLAHEQVANDQDNVRAALAWYEQRGDIDALRQMAGALWEFWYLRSQVTEGRRWLNAALSLGEGSDLQAHAATLLGIGALVGLQGDTEEALSRLEAATELFEELGDHTRRGIAFGCQGNVRMAQGDLAAAEPLYAAELAAYEAAGETTGIGAATINLARVTAERGDFERAATMLDRAIELYEGGFEWDMATALYFRGRVEQMRGDPIRALGYVQQSLAKYWAVPDPAMSAASLEMLAGIVAVCGQSAAAAQWLGAAERLREPIGRLRPWEQHVVLNEASAASRSALGPEDYEQAFAAGLAAGPEEAVAAALAFTPGEASGRRPPLGLTRREREVLRLLAEGCSDREIANALFISPKTAGVHVGNILAKFGVPSRAVAIAYAHRRGMANGPRSEN